MQNDQDVGDSRNEQHPDNMQNDRESSSDRPESSSGDGERSGGSNGGSSSSFAREAPARQQVPQYVDMVIPDYESSSANHEQNANPSVAASSESNRPRNESQEEDDQGESLSESQKSYKSDEESVCTPNDNDVLLNESGDHPGNLRYRAVVRHLAKKYTKVKIGYRRAAVQILVNAVKAQGGRFLKYGRDGKWKEVSDKKAYAKSSQAIRGTCRKVEIVSSRSRKRKSRRARRPISSNQETQRQPSNSETTTSSDLPEGDRRSNLEMIALRLQTKDESLTHLNLDLHTVNHDFLFPFAKALDSTDVLSSMQVRLSHMNRTNANALAWGIKRCRGLKQVKLSYGKLSEKSSIVLAGVLENPSIESLNLDENDISAEALKAICRMISQAKGSKLQRLSLENNPFGDEGAIVLSKLITANRTLRFLNVAGHNLQAAGIAALKAAIKKKTNCLFEVSGLEELVDRKRAVPESSEDSNEEPAKKRAATSAQQPAAGSRAGNLCSSEPAHGSTTSSSNETEMAPTSSDNAPSACNGSDDGPASSLNDSDDAPSSASS